MPRLARKHYTLRAERGKKISSGASASAVLTGALIDVARTNDGMVVAMVSHAFPPLNQGAFVAAQGTTDAIMDLFDNIRRRSHGALPIEVAALRTLVRAPML
jgi:hypothetical protein